jgi:hypothetical protein
MSSASPCQPPSGKQISVVGRDGWVMLREVRTVEQAMRGTETKHRIRRMELYVPLPGEAA